MVWLRADGSLLPLASSECPWRGAMFARDGVLGSGVRFMMVGKLERVWWSWVFGVRKTAAVIAYEEKSAQ